MGIRLGRGTYSEFGSGENYFETILKKLDERRNEIQNTIDEYFSEAEKKANELKQISGIVNQNKNAAAAAASSSYENLKECGNRVNICTSLTLEGKNYAQIVQKSFEDISEVFEIIKKIQQNVENLELNARAYANLAENNAALCKNLDDSTGRSAYKSECFASASEEAYEKARVIRERCEQIFSDIREYEKIIKNAKDYVSGEITIKSISANGSAIAPDENKNVNIPLANDTFDGLVTATEREKLQNLIGFDGKVSVTNKNFFESIPWKIADGVHKLVEDLSTGIPIGVSVYEGILISASHTESVVKFVDMINPIDCYEKHITQTLIYTQSGEKTEIKTRNACIITQQKTGELYEETYGDWKDAVDLSECVKVSDAQMYIENAVTIKSVSANGKKILPDGDKNVDIDGNTIVSESYLKGNGAPTETTVADFVGQMYLDNTNTKLYQCTSITTSETDGTKSYEWIKVIRENDYPTTGINGEAGVVKIAQGSYGLNVSTKGLLMINKASNSDINKKTNEYLPIVPANLDYAVRSVRPAASDTAPTTLAVNTLYSINNTSSTSVALTLPQGQNGDFVQYDFVTGTTTPTVTIQSTYGMTEFDFTPEANKIYSLFFDWGIIGNDGTNRYGWRISYAEYERVRIFPEEDL